MASIRIFQGTETDFSIDVSNEDGQPIAFGLAAIRFFARDRFNDRATMFDKVGSLPAPHPDINLIEGQGEIVLWIRGEDSSKITQYSEWDYYVELDPNDSSGPYAIDTGEIVIRPRIFQTI